MGDNKNNEGTISELNRIYGEIISRKQDEDMTMADYFSTLGHPDSLLCRIMIWHYKVFESGHLGLSRAGFGKKDRADELVSDIVKFALGINGGSVEVGSVEESLKNSLMEASEKIRDAMLHISKQPNEGTDGWDFWMDSLNEIDDSVTDILMHSDRILSTHLISYYEKEKQNGK